MFKTSIIDHTPRENIILLRTAFIDRHQGRVPVVHSITDLPSHHCCKFTLSCMRLHISGCVRTDAGTADRPQAGLVGFIVYTYCALRCGDPDEPGNRILDIQGLHLQSDWPLLPLDLTVANSAPGHYSCY
jgi:hypothetical protein